MAVKKNNYDKIVLNHLVFLSKEQRYALYEYQTVENIGVLTQYKIIKGKYSVQHDEVICKYVITTDICNDFVEVLPTYYKINLPLVGDELKKDSTADCVDLMDILDRKDGGLGCLNFNAIYTSVNNNTQGFHKVTIKDISDFKKSLAFTIF